jgi:hypothetical protein
MNEIVCRRLRALLQEQFKLGFENDFDALLKARSREMWIIGIDPKQRRLTDVCGAIGAKTMAAINDKGFGDTDAGFLADAHKSIPTDGKEVDVFLLNHDHFEKPDDFLIPLVVHELSHYLEQIGERPTPSEKDKNNAGALMLSLKRNVRGIHTYDWAHHLVMAARRIVVGGGSTYKTIREFVEAAVPEYDRKSPISILE